MQPCDSIRIGPRWRDAEVERLDEGIRGNGRPGLVSRVTALEGGVDALERRVAAFDNTGVFARLNLRGAGLKQVGKGLLVALVVVGSLAGILDLDVGSLLQRFIAP